jgi:hypothetical protein
MAANAHITGAPTRAPTFGVFDLSRVDDLANELDLLKTLIWVAVDLIAEDGPHGVNLLHVALHQHDLVDVRLQNIHSDLISFQQGARNA